MDFTTILMILLSLLFGGLMFYGLIFLFQKRKEQKDDIRRRVKEIARLYRKEAVLSEEMSKPLSERLFKPMLQGTLSGLRKFVPEKTESSKGKQSEKLKLKLRSAGIQMEPNDYQLLQLLVITGATVFAGVIAFVLTWETKAALIGVFIGLYGGYVVLRFRLIGMISKRKEAMSRQLPEVLDMLSVSVEAGLGLEQAILHVINNFKGPLIDELSVTSREMSMGRSRRDALLLLGDRCELDEVKSFARAIVQAGQMGISIKNVLRSQSEFMRQTRRNKIEEKAMQVSVKILIPMVIFIFPVIFIVLLGPAAVNIYETFN